MKSAIVKASWSISDLGSLIILENFLTCFRKAL